ncbi:MAG TPA: DUF4180 domain-containing protein [Saprospiraceae bacterium]|nr:DUF4180 domain-containing protein [Saprospiraceae bacterium]HNT20066.1 DUF4180 domain-containing protein [Saprospiraceae bacterium]
MKLITHHIDNIKIAELTSEEILINKTEDGLDLLGNLYFQGFDRILIKERDINPAFFDLKNGMAGELLQKFSNYRVRLAVVGDFSKYKSKRLKEFIFESNKLGHIHFVNSQSDAIKALSSN